MLNKLDIHWALAASMISAVLSVEQSLTARMSVSGMSVLISVKTESMLADSL